MYRSTVLLALFFFVFLQIEVGFAKDAKIALVIGNSNYEKDALANPINDAQLMADTLKGLGFTLIGGQALTDLDKENMQLQIYEFGKRLKDTKGIGLFYFAGHGVQINGENLLLPVSAKLENSDLARIYGIQVDEVLINMEAARNKMNILILDACRNNPFKSKSRGLSRGLKSVAAPSGTMVLYATRPGEVAADGQGSNGPFTASLVRYMQEPGMRLEDVMRETIKDVEVKTAGRQTPWQEGFVREDFYFTPNGTKSSASVIQSEVTQSQQPRTPIAQVSQRASAPSVKVIRQQPQNDTQQWITYGSFGLSAVSLGLGAIFLQGHNDSQSIAANPDRPIDERRKSADGLTSSRDATIVSFSLAAVFGGYGLYRILTQPASKSSSASESVMTAVIPTNGGLSFTLSGSL